MEHSEQPTERPTTGEVTQLLLGWRRNNDVEAFNRLIPLVYDELRRIASGIVHRNRNAGGGDPTLGPTALVQQAYLNLIDEKSVEWKDRAHFLAIAAREMRRIVIDHWRYKTADIRGGGQHPAALSEAQTALFSQPNFDMLALEELLQRLEALDQEEARIIDLHFFGGMTVDEIAEALDISRATVERKERHAKAWIYKQMTR